jgi:magnesium chelatase subunit D
MTDKAPGTVPVMSLAPIAAAAFAVDPAAAGGVLLRAAPGAERDRWLEALRAMLPPTTPWRRMPLHIDDDRLLGGLDLGATLRAGRPVASRGLLADADRGILVVAMAERLSERTAAAVGAVLDDGEVACERHGIASRAAARLGVVALDEGIDDERVAARLRERLGIHLVLPVAGGSTGGAFDGASDCASDCASAGAPWSAGPDVADIEAARARLADVRVGDDVVEALCAAALAMGIDSLRAPMLACRVARALAALYGRTRVDADDAAMAASLVLAPRATRLPATGPADAPEPEPPTAQEEANPAPEHESAPADAPAPSSAPDQEATPGAEQPLPEQVLEAARAAIPADVLRHLLGTEARPMRTPNQGKAGAARMGRLRGRPIGANRGEPRGGARLHLVETLRAAAPWQAIRRREAAARVEPVKGEAPQHSRRVFVRREDFHVWRFKQRSETTTVFVVDASGSSALHRLAEAKGAVELLLADCYVRRDSVAVVAFRGTSAEVLLPPTRSLVRAKRSLAGLPGGGGTPLAAGIDAANAVCASVRQRGGTPLVVLLTDGRANIALDGSPGRAQASADAVSAARRMRREGLAAVLLDTSPQPQPPAREVAAQMGARYLPLPHAGSVAVSQAVRAFSAAGGRGDAR